MTSKVKEMTSLNIIDGKRTYDDYKKKRLLPQDNRKKTLWQEK